MCLRLALFAIAAALAIPSASAHASTDRVSRGDAAAVLEAFGNGGWAIRLNGGDVLQGAPADGLVGSLAAIRPFAPFNGRHYCALDWHVIVITDYDGGDSSYTVQDFNALRSQTSIAFTLDGQPFATEETATKRLLRDLSFAGITTAYYFQQGGVVSPNELTVGEHKLTVDATSPSGPDQLSISFTIDAAGTGTCLQ